MKTLTIATGVVALGVLSGCQTFGIGNEEQITCLQPNRRVVVEVGGAKDAKPPKPKPGAKPGAKVKPGKPEPIMVSALAQGNTAFDPGSAVLKKGGMEDLDKMLKLINQGTSRDKRPTHVSSVVLTGHSDRLESAPGDVALSEARAKSVKAYLESKGIDKKLIFWQGLGSKVPVPVTKFCEP
ncbi:MAG: OmpA family protein [Pseudomonadota bacterium]